MSYDPKELQLVDYHELGQIMTLSVDVAAHEYVRLSTEYKESKGDPPPGLTDALMRLIDFASTFKALNDVTRFHKSFTEIKGLLGTPDINSLLNLGNTNEST